VSNKYWPRQIDEIDGPGTSWLNEPAPPDNVIALPKARSLHAVLVENLNSTQALLARLESGVSVAKDQQREIIRLLYVSARFRPTDSFGAVGEENPPAH
jgi:hypothetical protein